MRIRAAVALSVATLFWTLPAAAVSYTVMFERDDNVGAGEELVFRSYATYDDLLTNTSPTDVFSPIDLAANFSSTGLTYDGSRYTVMFERDDNVGGGEELVFRSYATYDDLLTNTSPTDVFSPIDLAANFSSSGLTYDGSRYTIMFERDDNVGGGEELVFRSYATYDDLLTNTSPTDVFSPIDLAANFSSTGLLSVPPPNGGGSGPAIPEPGALVLFAAGLATVCRPAWRRRSG